MVSEHGLTVKDYKELKTVEDSLKTMPAPQIKTEPTIESMDKSQDEQPGQYAVITTAYGKTYISQPPASTRDKTSNSKFEYVHVLGEKNPDEPPKISLANRCTFQCNRCAESFGSWRELRAHVGKVHNQRYIKCNFNEYAVAKVYHDCMECKAKVLQDYDAIRLHMLTHGVKNLEDYSKAINEEKETEKVDSPKNSLKNTEAEITLKGSDSADTSSKRGKSLTSTENMVGQKKKKATSGRRILSIRLRDVIKDGVACSDVHYSNKCKFRCLLCGYKSSAWKELRRHVSRNHLPRYKLYSQKLEMNPFEYATVRNFQECRICGEKLLHDAWIITSHNLREHRCLKLKEVTEGSAHNDSVEEEDQQKTGRDLGGSEGESEIQGEKSVAIYQKLPSITLI